MSKTVCFALGLFSISLFGALSFVFPGKSDQLPSVLTALVSLCTVYMGIQVANNGVKGKFFNKDLWNAECPEGDEIEGGKA